MGISLGGNDRRARNLDINLVPMIDLMSCLTAFLLVTAVWADHGVLETEPEEHGRAGQIKSGEERDVYGVLVQREGIVLSDRRSGDAQTFGRDWPAVRLALAEMWGRSENPGAAQLEIAGEDGTVYQDLIDAMAMARATGIRHIDVVDAGLLAGAGLK
jgi:biopolymer transport protein ExbD